MGLLDGCIVNFYELCTFILHILLFSFVMFCKNINIILLLLNILGIIKQDLMLLILLYVVYLTTLFCTTLPMATKRVAAYY
jgi:hypothetical protein